MQSSTNKDNNNNNNNVVVLLILDQLGFLFLFFEVKAFTVVVLKKLAFSTLKNYFTTKKPYVIGETKATFFVITVN